MAGEAVWRMAFRSGSQGLDKWDACFRRGIAAIAYGDLPDLSDVPEEQFSKFFSDYCMEEWNELSARGSRKTKLEDIAVVCPNCHQAIHTEDRPLAVEQLRGKLEVPF